jgi:dTDP-4-amino-4,6-dideoxygalactose transaminase
VIRSWIATGSLTSLSISIPVSMEAASYPWYTAGHRLARLKFLVDLGAWNLATLAALTVLIESAWTIHFAEVSIILVAGLFVKGVLIKILALDRKHWRRLEKNHIAALITVTGAHALFFLVVALVVGRGSLPMIFFAVEPLVALAALVGIRLAANILTNVTPPDPGTVEWIYRRRPAEASNGRDVGAAPAKRPRIYLSSPHMGGAERQFVGEAFDTNWIAPLGPHVDAFEAEFCLATGAPFAAALNSGTAALHLALILAGVKEGDDVIVSTLTFSASVNAIRYVGARPVMIDSENTYWNMDPGLLADALDRRARSGRLPAAVVLVHLYGQSADIHAIVEACDRYGIPVIEDAAEALGATYYGRSPGTFGKAGIFSFNGNKIITTSGGGMLVSDDEEFIIRARKLATQAREPAPHYEHAEVGFNYRLSNVLAGIGRGQLQVLEERVRARRRNFFFYREKLGDLPGIRFQPEAPWGRHTRWLTCLTIDPVEFGVNRESVRLALEAVDIEARPVWKPMHMQPVFQNFEVIGGPISERLFRHGLCLPSGSNLTEEDLTRVVDVLTALHEKYALVAERPARSRAVHARSAPF